MLGLYCPNCRSILSEIKRGDISASICSYCRGAWLGKEAQEKLLGSTINVWQENKNAASLDSLCESDIQRGQSQQEFQNVDGQSFIKVRRGNSDSAFDFLRALR